MNIKNIILDILFPTSCIGCGKEGRYICDECNVFISETMPVCPVCCNSSFFGESHSNCVRKYSLDGLISIWDYEGLIKNLIYKIKYDGTTHAISEIIENFFKLITNDKDNRFHAFLSFLSYKDTYITYVPMYIKKEKKRGFNQAELIAKEIGKISNRRIISLLKKIKNTESQTKLEKKERLENVKGSFENSQICDKPSLSQTENVLLVDDIFTTGATMKECCKVLKQSGARKVWGFVLARTP